jgi:hypothetical protein
MYLRAIQNSYSNNNLKKYCLVHADTFYLQQKVAVLSCNSLYYFSASLRYD